MRFEPTTLGLKGATFPTEPKRPLLLSDLNNVTSILIRQTNMTQQHPGVLSLYKSLIKITYNPTSEIWTVIESNGQPFENKKEHIYSSFFKFGRPFNFLLLIHDDYLSIS